MGLNKNGIQYSKISQLSLIIFKRQTFLSCFSHWFLYLPTPTAENILTAL